MADQEIREVGAKLIWAVEYEKELRNYYIDPVTKRIREGFFEAAKDKPAVIAFLNGVQSEIDAMEPDSTRRGKFEAIAKYRLSQIAQKQAAQQRADFVKAFAVVFGWEIKNVMRLIEPEKRNDLLKYLVFWNKSDKMKEQAAEKKEKAKKGTFEEEVMMYEKMAEHLLEGAKKIEKDSLLLVKRGFMKIIEERPMDQEAIMNFLSGKMKQRGLHLRMFTRSASTRYVGYLNMMRNKHLGIKKYRWISVMDDRTRETHAKNHDRVFSWDEEEPGDAEGRPGFEWNCRCTSRPIIDEETQERIHEMISENKSS